MRIDPACRQRAPDEHEPILHVQHSASFGGETIDSEKREGVCLFFSLNDLFEPKCGWDPGLAWGSRESMQVAL
jgi:hypothetical protein